MDPIESIYLLELEEELKNIDDKNMDHDKSCKPKINKKLTLKKTLKVLSKVFSSCEEVLIYYREHCTPVFLYV